MTDWISILYFCLSVLIIAASVALVIFIIVTVLYMPAFLQKKVNLKQAEDILNHNVEIVEKATFFETSQEFNKLIENQMNDIRANAAKLKSMRAEMEQLDRDITNKGGKSKGK